MPLRNEAQTQTNILSNFLRGFSTEVTARDSKSLDAAGDLLPPGTEVFVAFLPRDNAAAQAIVAARLRRSGLIPVPHVVARHLPSLTDLDECLARFAGEAGVDRALILAGDRDKPIGALESSLDIIQSGLLPKHGMQRIYISCYPEDHPRIATATLDQIRMQKIAAAQASDLDVTLISQFCFDPGPILTLARRMRSQGISVPFRVGVAGPTDHATLIKYAKLCGIGASARALNARPRLVNRLLRTETPERILTEVAIAQDANPALGISGAHFFTFASLKGLAEWMKPLC